MAKREITGFSRRELLMRGGAFAAFAVAAPSVLAACGTDAAPRANVGGTLRMLTWESYDLPKSSQSWRSANKVDVTATYVGSNDEIVAKLTAGKSSGAQPDLITYNAGYGDQLDALGVLQPIDTAQLPNYKQLFPFFRSDYKNFWVRHDGSVRGVPFIFNWNGITYNSAVTEAPESYDQILDPKWTGKVAITEDVLAIYQIAAHVVGVDPSKMDDNDFKKVESWVGAILKQTKGSSPTYGDMVTKLTSGDAVFAFPGWPGMNSLAAAAGNNTIKSVLPREGGNSACDAWAIPKSAANAVTAYSWIDFTCEPATGTQTAIDLVGGTPIAASAAGIPAAIKEGYDYDDIARLFDRAPMYPNPPLQAGNYKTLKDINDSWTQLKSTV